MGRYAVSNLSKVKIDEELRNLLRPLTSEEFNKLEENILKIGILDPFKVWEDNRTGEIYLIDGHNRYEICTKHNIAIGYWQIQYFDSNDFKTKDDVIKWILENQLGRRNLSVAERYEILQKYKKMFEVKAKANMSAGGKGSTTLPKVDTRKEMAKMVGTSEGTYTKLDRIFNSDNEEVKNKVRAGKVSIDKAFKDIKQKQKKNVENVVKPAANFNIIDEEFNRIDKGLKDLVGCLADTNDCDNLLDKIDIYNRKINNIKEEIFLARNHKYDEMKESELTCEVVEEGEEDILTHKVKFYLVKSDQGKINKKLALEISHSTLINTDTKNLDYWTENIKKKLSKQEFNVFYMVICKTRKEYIKLDEEKQRKHEEKRKRYWEKISRDIDKAFSGAFTGQVISENPEIKAIMKDIIRQGYRQLVKKYHPDVSHDDGNIIKILNLAKERLDLVIGK